jgi:uncharacterized membrane protein
MATREPEADPPRHRVQVHPMLVPIPIGCWVAGAIFDIASHLVGDPGFLTRGATWLLTIGVITAIIAGLAGLVDAMPIPPGTAANRAAVIHLSVATLTTLVQTTNLMLRLGTPDDRPVPVPEVALSVLAFLLLAGTGYYGGMVVHRYGVRVPGAPQPARAEERTAKPDKASGDAPVGWVREQK